MKRLHLVTEGHGDVDAAPELAMRVIVHPVLVEDLLAKGSASFDKFCREIDRLTR